MVIPAHQTSAEETPQRNQGVPLRGSRLNELPEEPRKEIMDSKTLVALTVVAVLLAGCSKHSPQKTEANPPPGPSTGRTAENAVAPAAAQRGVKTEIRKVNFYLTDQAAADLEAVSGELWPTGKNEMPNFDDKTSFELRVANGRISITPKALASILNTYVFARSDAPLKDLSVAIAQDQLRIKGKLHGKGDIPFETAGSLSVSDHGRIRLNTEKMKALHVPVKGVLGLFGIDLANVINTRKTPGIDTDKNDLLMDLETLLPPPHIRGKLTGVKLESNAIVTYFGDGKTPDSAKDEPKSYMTFEGNPIQFGKLTMESADLVVYDMDPGRTLEWSPDHYRDQLVAGYSKITPAFGLRAYVKDYSQLARGPESRSSAAPPDPAASRTP